MPRLGIEFATLTHQDDVNDTPTNRATQLGLILSSNIMLQLTGSLGVSFIPSLSVSFFEGQNYVVVVIVVF